MPDPTPEQPPSWPPASEPAATPTNPPRITARGVGHLPSAPSDPEEDAPEEDAPAAGAPGPAPGDFADLTADPPLPNRAPEAPVEPEMPRRHRTPEPPPPVESGLPRQHRAPGSHPPPAEPEVPRQQQWGEPPDMSGQWPPPENRDWISRQAHNDDWGPGQGGAPWSGPSVAEPASSPADQSYLPNPNAEPYHGGAQAADPYQRADSYETGGYETGPYEAGARGAERAPESPEAHRASPEPEPSEPEPSSSDGKIAAPPTHAGVRYAIYGIGGIIALGLIIAIVLMLGGSPAGDSAEEGGEDSGGGSEGGEALDAERYAELADAVGTAEWFEYRYGSAGENAASEEVSEADGDALASEPLLGDADRSVQGQLAYMTDDAELSGIDHVSVVEATDELLGVAPRAGGRFSQDGPELELTEGSTADCVEDLGGELGAPVALARPEHSGEIDAHSVIAFANGVLATAGISGAQGGTCLRLPDGLVPTDVALTDGNELALVTTWNPADQTGALVVVALADKAGSYNSSWSEPYPGLPNPGHFGSAEIIGQVELPTTAPTSVDAWSDSSGSISTGRTTVDEESHADTVATSAYAVVGSLSEDQAVKVDLTAVLTGLAAQHIEGAEFAFEAEASDPVDFDGGVADVAANGEALAVATGDGVVHELDADMSETGTVEVGPNPTCLVVGEQSEQFIATSRGDSSVSWVSEGEVVSELTDARLTDATCASETPALDVQGYEGNAAALLVTDYEGQALHTYLVGSASLPDGAEIGGDGFAYGGSYTVQGRPFAASVTLDLG